VYFADSLQLTPLLQFTLSGRYDRSTVDNLDALTPEDEAGTLTASHRFSRFNPAAGLTFTPTPGLTAYLGYNEGSRAPSAIELGCADPDNPCRLPNAMAGDPPLDQVRTRTIEAGIRGVFASAIAWNAGVFRADNRDDIMFVADDQAGFGYFRNFGKTRRQGIELGSTVRFGTFKVDVNYTYLDATYRSAEEVAGEGNSSNEEGPGFEGTIDIEPGARIPLIPRHIVKAGVEWDILTQLTASVDAMNISGVYARGNENNEHEADGVYYIGRGRTGGYTVVNLGVELQPMASLKLFVQASNLLDRNYFTGSQLGSTGFDSGGSFVARPFAGPIVDGERPLLGSTFLAPGAPRSFWVGAKYSFFGSAAD
jgi:outer membrane receptor protein involved in Fe transport